MLRRYFNETSINDPAWNYLGCSPNTSYLQENDTSMAETQACVCATGFFGLQCEKYSSAMPLIQLVGSQIICGTLNAVLLLTAVAMIIVTLRRDSDRNGKLRLFACLGFIAGLLLRIVWLIDMGNPDDLVRAVPKVFDSFLYWIPFGFYTFAAAFVVGLWMEILTNKLVVFKIRWTLKAAVSAGVIFLVIQVVANIGMVAGIEDFYYLSNILAGLTTLILVVFCFVIALIARKRLRALSASAVYHKNDGAYSYATRISLLFLLVPISMISLILLAIFVLAYEPWAAGDYLTGTCLDLAELLSEVATVFIFESCLTRVHLWGECRLAVTKEMPASATSITTATS